MEWWTDEKMSNAFAMERDIERLTDPRRAEAWRGWLAGETQPCETVQK
jgi:hypothetical protein